MYIRPLAGKMKPQMKIHHHVSASYVTANKLTCSFFHNFPPFKMPVICAEILFGFDKVISAELGYVGVDVVVVDVAFDGIDFSESFIVL